MSVSVPTPASEVAVLQKAVHLGDNILVSGGTPTGKTTLVNILADSIPDEDRILIIEDTAELAIRRPHVVSAEAQLDTHKSAITFDDLLKAILRHRPDRIIVGEVRGAEAHSPRRPEYRASRHARHHSCRECTGGTTAPGKLVNAFGLPPTALGSQTGMMHGSKSRPLNAPSDLKSS
jgi:energy-coupling factor transporter ATP-binding protein EcfA2